MVLNVHTVSWVGPRNHILDGSPEVNTIYIIILPKVCLYALTLYPARADCTAATDTSGVTGYWQLSR